MNSAGRHHVALLGAQARQRLVIAHLALRQRDDRLQIKIDAVAVDGRGDRRAHAFAADGAEHAAGSGKGFGFAERQRSLGDRRRVQHRLRRLRHHALLLQDRLVAGNGLGQLLDHRTEFADLDRQRIDRATRAIDASAHVLVHVVEPPRHLGHLPRQIGGAARQVANLVAEMAAVAQPAGNAVVEHHADERCQRHDRRGARVDLEAEIERRADRGGDEHHAGRDENGADASHEVCPGTAERK